MSYEKILDDLIAEKVAQFQDELILGREMRQLAATKAKTPPMPYGYPIGVYHPHHVCHLPVYHRYTEHHDEPFSNGVPRVLALHVENQEILGVYNPRHEPQPLKQAA